MKKLDMNLITEYRRLSSSKANKKAVNRIYIMILVGLFLVMGALWLRFHVEYQFLRMEVETLEEYINNPVIVKQIDEVNALQADIDELDAILIQVLNINEALDYIPRYDSIMIDTILDVRPGTIRIQNMTFSGDRVVLSVSGTKMYSISDFVLRLDRLNYFQEVIFGGYTLQEGLYVGEINCIVKGGR